MFLEFDSEATELADFNYFEQDNPVISKALTAVLKSFNLKDVQFIPVSIQDTKGKEHEGFNIINVYNKFPYNYHEIIKKIPLEERLVFIEQGNTPSILYHRSVVEKMLELNPTGLRVIEVYESWNPELESKEEYFDRLFADDDD
ncbi:hypothetical protein M2475_000861 [Breznakia sp. PF5-3]|uniref:hypothetical protein n=1 Tax=unclassified Breznakia TaxID=2623764 RepID=UPI002406B3A4|nr:MULTISPECIES: hypothetical protein [unclassified Breznakia]MDF9824510.1 hypothetical protein [Breznakia sp. PM6-1]MDF9835296.1 hypothetical protein [Breznakia sp. PF5-3]MDF9837012.1 hypothetical protein [Breznakia sp. PFB2-8]MDF9858937.1 hypothetical protein [Breznakia sp. PH5-24]